LRKYSKIGIISIIMIIIIGLSLITSTLPATGRPQQVVVRGRVLTSDGKPHTNTIIVAYDTNYAIGNFTKSDENGYFEMTLERGRFYRIVVYPLREDESGFSHIPEMVELLVKDLIEVNLTLIVYPAAFVKVEGVIRYVGGEWSGFYSAIVLTPEGVEIGKVLDSGEVTYTRESQEGIIKTKPQIIDAYGSGRGIKIYYRRGVKKGVLPAGVFDENLVIIPAGIDAIVSIETRVFDRRSEPFLREFAHRFVFTIGDPLNPLRLEAGALTRFDMEYESLGRIIEEVRRDVQTAEQLIEQFENMGFYLAPERAELSRALSLVEEAQLSYESGRPPDVILEKLEKAFVIVTQNVAGRIFFLKTVALEGAPILSYFIAVFAVVMAYYFYEDPRKKLYSFLAFYALLLLLFSYSYPGFTLLWENKRDLFLAAVLSSFLGITFLIFYLPRHIKEAELPGAIRKGAIMAMTFSIAKRFSKLKKTRTLITVFSLSALIWAFTVLASISSVYGVWSEENPVYVSTTSLLAKYTINESIPGALGYFSDYEWFVEKVGAENVSPRVYNNPAQMLVIEVEGKGVRVSNLKAIFGLAPVEDKITGISKILVKGSLEALAQPDSIYIPFSLATQLGVDVGDKVTLRVYRPGVEMPVEETYTVAGIFDEDKLDKIIDIDGEPLKPFISVKGKLLPANSTDIVIMNWRHLLMEVLVEKEAAISSVFQIYKIAVLGGRDTLTSLATSFIERKGENYFAYINTGDRCLKYFFGQKVENILTSNIDFVVPILIVVFNVLLSMYSIVNERRREIFIFNAIGFNPMHIALLFLAESIVYGLISGGLGYIAGITTFRIMSITARTQNLLVREKLEWYWSILAIIISILVAMIASFKPALNAAMMYTPSKVRRVKVEEKEKIKREERILKTYAGKTYPFSTKVKEDEALIFFSFLYTRLRDIMTGYRERVVNLEELEEEELPDGTLVKRFLFKYTFIMEKEKRIITENEIKCTKSPKEKVYRIELYCKPSGEKEIPVQYMDRVATTINDILKSWEEERKLILRSSRR